MLRSFMLRSIMLSYRLRNVSATHTAEWPVTRLSGLGVQLVPAAVQR